MKRSRESDESSKSPAYVWGLGLKKMWDGDGSQKPNSSHHRSSGKGHNDPYEFDDENHRAPAVNMEGLKRKDEKVKVMQK